jgi:argininosuccinate lyase
VRVFLNLSLTNPMSETPAAPLSTPRANALWGGRFAAGPSELLQTINASIAFDQRLAAEDIAGSQAHAAMLARQGILSAGDHTAIAAGLQQIAAEVAAGTFVFQQELEDIHMNIESRLRDIIGPMAGRLHTARSRNDQVATDFRLWIRNTLDRLDSQLRDLQQALLNKAEQHAATVMPGFTHLQTAQPVTFGHHLMAYVEMFGRDRGRLGDCRRRLNECPLGAAALAGTSFAIDRQQTAAALGFDHPMRNSIDAVSSRDGAAEFLAAAALCMTHLSRLAEEIVLWCSAQFGYVRLSDAYTTGSSIMPQKRNPDAAELVRGKTGRVTGALMGLLMVMKGLPLAYSKDLQEDKEGVFDAADTLAVCLAVMAGMITDLEADTARMAADAGSRYSTATDLADWLVQVLALPFRDAHHVTGAIVRRAEVLGMPLHALPLSDMQAIEPRITGAVFAVLTPEASVSSRHSLGGTAPERVREAIAAARARFLPETQ